MAASKTLYLHIPAIASLIFLNDIKAARCPKKKKDNIEFLPEERLKAVLERKNKQEGATSNKLHVFRI